MDVDTFIAKYRPEWARLEKVCANGARGLAALPGPEIAEVLRLYLRASAHLAEAQTAYGDPDLERYLNGVIARAHGALYASRPRTLRGFFRFFGVRYRAAVRRTAPFIAVAAVVLIAVSLAMAIWVATSEEARTGVLPGFARDAISGAAGENERPDIGIPPSALSSIILANNVQVALLAFALGIGFGIPTLYMLVRNAELLGALAGAYHAAGEPWTFWSLVLPHGFLELTAICIAGGAGLRIGWSLIDPGDRPRGAALIEESRDSVMVVAGVVPAFVLAALLEGFVTSRTGAPWVEVAIGALIAAAYVAFLFAPRRSKAVPAPTVARAP